MRARAQWDGFNTELLTAFGLTVRRTWWIALVLALLASGAVYAYVSAVDVRYESSAIVKSWRNPGSSRLTTDRTAEALINAIDAKMNLGGEKTGIIRVKEIKSSGNLVFSVRSGTAADARLRLQSALKMMIENTGSAELGATGDAESLGFGNQGILLAPTEPSQPLPARSLPIAVLAGLASVLLCVAFAILMAIIVANRRNQRANANG